MNKLLDRACAPTCPRALGARARNARPIESTYYFLPLNKTGHQFVILININLWSENIQTRINGISELRLHYKE